MLGGRDGSLRECGDRCACAPSFGNRRIQRGVAVRLRIVSQLYKWWGLHAAEALGCRPFVCDLWLSHAPLPPPFLCFSPKTEHNFSRNPTLDPVLSPVLPCMEEKGRKVGGREEELRSTSLPAAVALSCPRYDVVVIFPALPSISNRHLSLLLLQIYMHYF
jgi:hypothetical protein